MTDGESSRDEKTTSSGGLESPDRLEMTLEGDKPEPGSEASEGRDGAADDSASLSAQERIAELELELEELRDRSLRTVADFDNYRKRIERERGDLKRFALADAMREILGVVDNLERALAAEGSYESLKQGVEMILQQMREFLGYAGVERIAAQGEPFDPRIHEAVAKEVDPEATRPVVTEELQPGYFLHERLLRPALVKVAIPEEVASDAGVGGELDEPDGGDGDSGEVASAEEDGGQLDDRGDPA